MRGGSLRRATASRVALRGAAVAALGAALTAACGIRGPTAPPQVPDGDPVRGAAAISTLGCGACHVIPGVREADGTVGPPLTDWAARGFIAGRLPNTGPNLIRWIMDPQAVEPGTAMPDLGVSEDVARDIAAYLFTLEP